MVPFTTAARLIRDMYVGGGTFVKQGTTMAVNNTGNTSAAPSKVLVKVKKVMVEAGFTQSGCVTFRDFSRLCCQINKDWGRSAFKLFDALQKVHSALELASRQCCKLCSARKHSSFPRSRIQRVIACCRFRAIHSSLTEVSKRVCLVSTVCISLTCAPAAAQTLGMGIELTTVSDDDEMRLDAFWRGRDEDGVIKAYQEKRKEAVSKAGKSASGDKKNR